MATDRFDIEKGMAPPAVTVNENNGEHTPLELFQLLVGIHTPPSLLQNGAGHGDDSARTTNIGLYQRAKDHERQARIAYLCTSIISNSLYMLQILLAATFTALSAYKDSSAVTLTVLGALNTVVAGSLAWQKGQGVPQRYRKAQDQYQALILEIEMTERSFLDVQNSNDPDRLDPRKEKARLQALFDTARADQQANYPDLYVSTAGGTAGAASPPSKEKETKDLAAQLDTVKADAAKVQAELLAKIETLMGKLDTHAEAAVDKALKI